MIKQNKVLVIFGPTASGKTSLGIDLAKMFNGEVVNADSRQVYRHMPIITAMPTTDEQAQVPHHLYEILEPEENFSAVKWAALAKDKIQALWAAGKLPILVGGTGFYLKTLMEGIGQIPATDEAVLAQLRNEFAGENRTNLKPALTEADPVLGEKYHEKDTQRLMRALAVYRQTGKSLTQWQAEDKRIGALPADYFKLAINPDRAVLHQRIEGRFVVMQQDGLMAEMEKLLAKAPDLNLPAYKSIGLPVYDQYLKGELSLEKAHEKVVSQMRQYAKRQVTWLRHQFQADLVIENNDISTAKASVQQWLSLANN